MKVTSTITYQAFTERNSNCHHLLIDEDEFGLHLNSANNQSGMRGFGKALVRGEWFGDNEILFISTNIKCIHCLHHIGSLVEVALLTSVSAAAVGDSLLWPCSAIGRWLQLDFSW
jgi:hypothetical protein